MDKNSRNADLAACKEVKRLYGTLTMVRSSVASAASVTDTSLVSARGCSARVRDRVATFVWVQSSSLNDVR